MLAFDTLDANGGLHCQPSAPETPEKALILAVLKDCLLVFKYRHTRAHCKQFQVDLNWIRESSQRPFGFAWVCAHLKIDADKLRAHLLAQLVAERSRLRLSDSV